MTVRQLLSHQAGLAAIDRPLSVTDLADLDVVATALADADAGLGSPAPATATTDLARLVRGRAHPPGRPAAAHAWAGSSPRRSRRRSASSSTSDVPDSVDPDRIALIHGFKPAEMMLHLNAMPWQFVAGFLNPRSITARSLRQPEGARARPPTTTGPRYGGWSCPPPTAPAQVRAIARAYGAAATGGASSACADPHWTP